MKKRVSTQRSRVHFDSAWVYRGPAAGAFCAESAAHMLEQSKLVRTVGFVGPKESRDVSELSASDCQLYVQPGGDDLDSAFAELGKHRKVIRKYVRHGGSYLGMCLGGYLAGHSPGFGLLPVDCGQYAALAGIGPKAQLPAIETIAFGGKTVRLYAQDPPYFGMDHDSVDVLATYTNGRAAATLSSFGSGRVAVIGPHPEADETWFGDDGLGRGPLDRRRLRQTGQRIGNAMLEELLAV